MRRLQKRKALSNDRVSDCSFLGPVSLSVRQTRGPAAPHTAPEEGRFPTAKAGAGALRREAPGHYGARLSTTSSAPALLKRAATPAAHLAALTSPSARVSSRRRTPARAPSGPGSERRLRAYGRLRLGSEGGLFCAAAWPAAPPGRPGERKGGVGGRCASVVVRLCEVRHREY